MTKIEKAILYVQRQIEHHSVYVWGGQGKPLLKKLTVRKLAEMEDTENNASRVMAHIKKYLKKIDWAKAKPYDCSGLIIEALKWAGLITDKDFDCTADSLMKKYTPISKTVRKAGDLCFKVKNGHAYHVGMLLDENTVGEAKGRDYGCVSTALDESWTDFRRVVK